MQIQEKNYLRYIGTKQENFQIFLQGIRLFVLQFECEKVIILFLTVSKNKIAAMPENIGVVAILTVVLNYSILFPSFTFFLDGFHLAFGDKFEICIKTTDLM